MVVPSFQEYTNLSAQQSTGSFYLTYFDLLTLRYLQLSKPLKKVNSLWADRTHLTVKQDQERSRRLY